ncbi:iron-binding protein [Saccharomycopsis crataegensis]|uniref:Iron-sulfur cluster assembly protein n=1 Tax=Saccharomycopsis crataegensis TaxID=43959 RepID=A0AAV5QL73_9ASCO|nr:iron-binding protein [Saccharomycopsis crataegensis]
MFSRTIARTVFTRVPTAVSSTPSLAVAASRTKRIHNNLPRGQYRAYHQKVIDHYQNPRNVGTMDKNDLSVGTGLVGAPACGDVMRLQIKVNDDTGIIEDVKFKTFGCGSAIASSSFATELLKGKSLDDALKIKNTVIAKELSLPPVKLHCSMLAEDAIKSAVKDYRIKKGKKTPTLGPDAVSPSTGARAAA